MSPPNVPLRGAGPRGASHVAVAQHGTAPPCQPSRVAVVAVGLPRGGTINSLSALVAHTSHLPFGSGDTVHIVNAPTWLIDAVRAAVQPTGAETADWYETWDEHVVVVRGREFVMFAARVPPGSGVPRGPIPVALIQLGCRPGEYRQWARRGPRDRARSVGTAILATSAGLTPLQMMSLKELPDRLSCIECGAGRVVADQRW